MHTFHRVWRAYGAFLGALGLVAGIVTFAMMVLVVVNVIGRYAFNSPVGGAFEVAQSMLTVIVFFSLALTQFHDGHIKVVLLTRLLPARLQRPLSIAVLLLGAAFFAVASYGSFNFAWESWLINEQEWSSIVYPLYPVKFVVFFGLALLSIQFVLSAIHVAVDPAEDAHPETL